MTDIDTIATQVADILHECFGIARAALSAETTLRDLGLDSMHLVEILVSLENVTGRKLLDLSLPPDPTFAELTASLHASLQAA